MLGLGPASDLTIGDIAEADGRILISKDDVLRIRHPDCFGLIWNRIGNATNRTSPARPGDQWIAIEAILLRGGRLIEIR